MKLKPIVGAISVVLGGVAASAMTSAGGSGEPQKLQTIDLSQPQYQEYKAEFKANQVLENGGQNVQLVPSESRKKFVREEGITGYNKYFVNLAEAPAALYDGGLQGLAGTKQVFQHSANQRRGVNALQQPEVKNYLSHLEQNQQQFVQQATSMGVNLQVQDSFKIAVNAVTAELTQDQAEQLATSPLVKNIRRVKMHELTTDWGPEFIGAKEIWDGTTDQMTEFKGEGVLVGILDTGINTDHPAFAAEGGDGYLHTNPLGSGVYLHDCADANNADMCNDKLIGVWSHSSITEVYTGHDPVGEDFNGHGSHTASTVAGNIQYDVPFVVPESGAVASDGMDTGFDIPMVSGVAPHANIISYQVCYPGNAGDMYAGCPGDALVAGVEQAILDGVDVINYSISGGSDPWNDAIELAFLSAREAGISVAASAGNAGPEWTTVAHVSPWLTSVAASTHGRNLAMETRISYEGYIDTETGTETPTWAADGIVGGSLNDTEITGVVVWAKDYNNIDGAKDQYCGTEYAPSTFDNYKDGTPILDSTGARPNVLVVCARNNLNDANAVARTVKSDNIKAGGANGFIMYNYASGDGEPVASYSLPSVHLSYEAWNGVSPDEGLEDWIDHWSERGHMITIHPSAGNRTINLADADKLADFSSRGPVANENLRETMVPAVTAPGVAIYAAYADEMPYTMAPRPADYASLQGTSMSSPHVAGAMTLIKQAHPDWTPAEIQSALMLTATPQVADPAQAMETALPWATGSGRIQVNEAVDAELIMDVPVEQYMRANPENGGNLGALNTPYAIDTNCIEKCTWVRTVEATVDGTWSLSGVSGEASVKISAMPETITLKAGEKANIIITGEWVDSQNMYENYYGLSVFGAIEFTNTNTPDDVEARMPVEMVLGKGQLPTHDTIKTHRDAGLHTIDGLTVSKAPELTARVFEPVKPTVETITLSQRMGGSGSNLFEVSSNNEDPSVHMTWVDVPEGAIRFKAAALENLFDENVEGRYWGQLGLYVGIDLNGDGIAQYDSEAVCKSVLNTKDGLDFCNINLPDAGKYWVAWQNHGTYGTSGYEDTFKVGTYVVTDAEATNMTISTPYEVDAGEPFTAEISWDALDLEVGEHAEMAIDFGSSAGNLGNLGMMPITLIRGENEVSVAASQTAAVAGDIVDVTVKVQPNLDGADRSFSLSTTLPEGMTLVEESLSVPASYEAGVAVEGNQLTISGVQPNSKNWDKTYNLTNSVDDATCRAPLVGVNPNGGYADLHKAGILPMDYFSAAWTGDIAPVPFSWIGWSGHKSALFHSESPLLQTDTVFVHPNGALDYMGMMNRNGMNSFFNDSFQGSFQLIGAMWHGWFGGAFGAPYNPSADPEENSGTSLAFTDDHMLIEWDNLSFMTQYDRERVGWDWIYTWYPAEDHSFDAQVILQKDYDHRDGKHEIYVAYDNMNWGPQSEGIGSVGDLASAGVKGINGPLTAFGGAGPGGNPTVAISNGTMEATVKEDGMVFCLDYAGPESTQIDVSFSVRIDETAAGTTQDIVIDNNVEGVGSVEASHSIEVPSNLMIADMADQTVEEDGSLTDIMVAYMDSDRGSNVITVEGEHIVATVNGHDAGDTFDIALEENFNGTTEVTVTVADELYSNDKVSTTFTLTVTPVNDAPEAVVTSSFSQGTLTLDASGSIDVDGDNLSYAWSTDSDVNTTAWGNTPTIELRGLSAGGYVFEVEVSDGIETSVAEVTVDVSQNNQAPSVSTSSKKGGAAFYLFALLGLATMLRRKQA